MYIRAPVVFSPYLICVAYVRICMRVRVFANKIDEMVSTPFPPILGFFTNTVQRYGFFLECANL